MSYFKRIKQEVVADDNNSSTINLQPYDISGGADLFTGVATSTLGVAGIQVSLKTDQNCTVMVEQSPDAINWDISDTFNYYASINNFGITVQAINSYIRVKVLNLGSLATTYFRLQTALCPIVEALPRSLSSKQYLKTYLQGMEDGYGFEVENTPMGEMRVVEPVRLVGATFTGNTLDTNFWTPGTNAGASITQANNQLTLATGTTANASTSLQSVRTALYTGGSSNRFRSVVRLPDTGASNNIRRWGCFSTTDGAYFELNGTTFSVVLRKTGSEIKISSGSFNGILGAIYTPGTNVVTYEIYFTNTKVYFVIGDSLLHTYSANITTWSDTLNFPIRYENNNSGGGNSNVSLEVRVGTIYRLGKIDTLPAWKNITTATTTICKYGQGYLHHITVNTPANNTITIYDNTSGTGNKIGTIALGNNTTPFIIPFDLPFFNGLTIVTGATMDITIVYE